MIYLVFAVSVIVGLGLIAYWFVNTSPQGLKRGLTWLGLVILMVLVGLVVFRARLDLLWWVAGVALPFIIRWRSVWNTLRTSFKNASGPTPGQTSTIQTDLLEMTLDHDSGEMAGRVIAGRFAGASLSELELSDLVDLLAEASATDEQSAQVLETYLDRVHGDAWREMASGGASGAGSGGSTSGAGAAGGGGPMSRAQALNILGLEEGASPDDVRDAHKRLMKANHPDRGGSTWLASQINRAKDTLIGTS